MPNYLDILHQFQDKSRLQDVQGYSPVNPYTSEAHIGTHASDIFANVKADALKHQEFSDIIPPSAYVEPDLTQKGLSSWKNVETASTIVANPALQTSLQSAGTYAAGAYPGAFTATSGTAGSAGGVTVGTGATATQATGTAAMGAGTTGMISAIAYGMANDNNPYTYDTGEAVGMGVGDYMAAQTVMTMAGVAAPWLPFAVAILGYMFRSNKAKKKRSTYTDYQQEFISDYDERISDARRKRDFTHSLTHSRDQGNVMYGGYAMPENINTMQTADTGMKYTSAIPKYSYNMGGINIQDITAEFTGNELIVNNQDIVEQGLKEKDYSKAAAPIRKALRGGIITPG